MKKKHIRRTSVYRKYNRLMKVSLSKGDFPSDQEHNRAAEKDE